MSRSVDASMRTFFLFLFAIGLAGASHAADPHRDRTRRRLSQDAPRGEEIAHANAESGQTLKLPARLAPTPAVDRRNTGAQENAALTIPAGAPPPAAVPGGSFHPLSATVAPSVRRLHEASALLFAKKKNWEEAGTHARRSGDASLQSLIEWMRLRDGDTVAPLEDYAYFLSRPKEWPEEAILLQHAREAMLVNGIDAADIKRWNGFAQRLGAAEKADPAAFVRRAYVEGDFTTFEENLIRTRYANLLRADETTERADRLIWEERYTQALRLLPLLPDAQRATIEARTALLQDQLRARLLYAGLSKAQKSEPGVLYAAMRFAMQKKDDETAEKYLMAAPRELPYPGKWWRTRASLIRDAIEQGNVAHAQTLLDHAGDLHGDEQADALFMQGWLKYQFANQPKDAAKYFTTLFEAVKFPVSKARAAFWAGLAMEKSGDKAGAQSWFARGAAYPTQFYGQLSAAHANPNAALRLPATPVASAKDKAALAHRPAVAAMRILIEQDEPLLADKFLGHLIDTSSDEGQIAQLAAMGNGSDNHYLGVKAAKRALRANVVLAQSGWPTVKVGFVPVIEPALMFAITRQESEFRPGVRSTANAIGMMQLLPKTAAHTAKQHNVGYRREEQLLQPAYNMLLGSYYLGGLVEKYDGNYMLAIAAYNGGPSNVNQWIGRFGTPGKNLEQSLKWLEQIPFSETRNYVQRVLENLQVYRQILAAKGKAPRLAIEQDIAHPTLLRELPTE